MPTHRAARLGTVFGIGAPNGGLERGWSHDYAPSKRSRRLEQGLANGGYTYFGRFFDRLLESRGLNQSTFAAECRRRKLKVGRPGKQRDVGQRSVSDWMRGYAACPREVPAHADAILVLSEEEWTGFALAYAYGQTMPEEDFEDLLEFRNFYRARLSDESPEGCEDRAKKG